jgi:DNA polymerase III alpha subunit
MHRLFGRYPEALARTVEVVERCGFHREELTYQYPEEGADPTLTPQATLEQLTWEGAAQRYPEGLPDDVRATLKHELRLIEKLQYPLLPDGELDRPLRTIEGHSLPGPRIGGQLGSVRSGCG